MIDRRVFFPSLFCMLIVAVFVSLALGRDTVGSEEMIVRTAYVRGGARIRWRGADLKAVVRTPREAELAALMPEKLPPDTSKQLLCPMPGLVVKISVAEGDEVFRMLQQNQAAVNSLATTKGRGELFRERRAGAG